MRAPWIPWPGVCFWYCCGCDEACLPGCFEPEHKVYAGELKLGSKPTPGIRKGKCFGKIPGWRGVPGCRGRNPAWTELTSQDVSPYSAASIRASPFINTRKGGPRQQKVKGNKIHSRGHADFSMPVARFQGGLRSRRSYSVPGPQRESDGLRRRALRADREYSHPFSLEQAVDLAEIEADPAILKRIVRPVEDALPTGQK